MYISFPSLLTIFLVSLTLISGMYGLIFPQIHLYQLFSWHLLSSYSHMLFFDLARPIYHLLTSTLAVVADATDALTNHGSAGAAAPRFHIEGGRQISNNIGGTFPSASVSDFVGFRGGSDQALPSAGMKRLLGERKAAGGRLGMRAAGEAPTGIKPSPAAPPSPPPAAPTTPAAAKSATAEKGRDSTAAPPSPPPAAPTTPAAAKSATAEKGRDSTAAPPSPSAAAPTTAALVASPVAPQSSAASPKDAPPPATAEAPPPKAASTASHAAVSSAQAAQSALQAALATSQPAPVEPKTTPPVKA